MATMMDQSEVTAVGRTRPRATRPSPLPLTLYDLITAIQDVVGPADDGLVVATVRHLLGAGRLTRCGGSSWVFQKGRDPEKIFVGVVGVNTRRRGNRREATDHWSAGRLRPTRRLHPRSNDSSTAAARGAVHRLGCSHVWLTGTNRRPRLGPRRRFLWGLGMQPARCPSKSGVMRGRDGE
jgi:hypothetical protein